MREGFSKNMKEKNRNAYLLFYDRVKYYDENGSPIDKLIDEKLLKNISSSS